MLRSVKYGLHGAVLAGLIAVPLAWNSTDKHVQLLVDGSPRTVTTTATTVGQALRAGSITLGAHDAVSPEPRARVSDGMQVQVHRGRLLRLDVDGRSAAIWTTATTVRDALGRLGVTGDDAVSLPPSTHLPLGATSISIRSPQPVTVVHDGTVDHLSTTDVTVREVLADLHVRVDADDTLSAEPGSTVAGGQTIRVQRPGERTVVSTQSVDYTVVRKADPSLAAGTTKVVSKGKNGTKQTTYAVTHAAGAQPVKTPVTSQTVQAAQPEVIVVGTQGGATSDAAATLEVTPPGPDGAKSIAKTLLAARGWGADEYSCLLQMWTRESGWRTDAANPSGAYGIPQSLPGSKMAAFGADWRTNPETQIKWGLAYIASRYGTPCGAWTFWQAHIYY